MVCGSGQFSIAALAVAEELPFLRELVALFALAVVLTYLSHRLKLVPIVGFLFAGVLAGPGIPAATWAAILTHPPLPGTLEILSVEPVSGD